MIRAFDLKMADNNPTKNGLSTSANKKKRKFNHDWLKQEGWQWLRYDSGKEAMFCDLCIKYKKGNSYCTGCKDFQKSSIDRHSTSEGHKSSLASKKHAVYWERSAANAEKSSNDGLIPQMRTVKYIAEQNLSLATYRSLIDLQQQNGANIPSPYTHHQPVEEMLEAISNSIQDEIRQDTKDAKFVGIMVDESVDIAVFKKLVIYTQVVVNGRVRVFFATNKNVEDGRADTIVAALQVIEKKKRLAPSYQCFLLIFFWKKLTGPALVNGGPTRHTRVLPIFFF